ncbi:hypothetical protein JOM56_005031 [Amanita muscaria]
MKNVFSVQYWIWPRENFLAQLVVSLTHTHAQTTMVKSTKPSFPWDQIKAESMRSLCRDLGLKQPHTTRSTMIDFLESVWKVGLPKALDNASATTPSSALRTSQKRTRDTPTTVTTASSVSNGDESSPSKRHRRGPDVRSDYNTRYKADRRGRLSDPGPIERRSGRPSANGTSAVVERPVRTSKRRRLSPIAASTRSVSRAGNLTSAASRPGRRVTLGEPLASDATADDDYEEQEEEEEEETSISAAGAKRRRVVVTPPIIRTRKQKEKEEGVSAASTRRRANTSTPKRALNGVVRKDDEYQPEQDEDEDDYEDEEEEGAESAKIRHLPRRLPRRFQPKRRRSSASPSKRRAATASPRQSRSSRTSPKRPAVATKAGRGRPRRRPRANSVKFVFDGVDVPPVNVAWKKNKKTDDETVHDEDADGEIDEEVHPPSAPVPKEREVTEGEEAQEPTEAGEPEEEHEQEGGEVEKAEAAAEEQGEAPGVPERQEEASGAAQPEEEQVESSVVEGQAEDEDETMDQGEDQVGIGLIPDDTSSLGNSNKGSLVVFRSGLPTHVETENEAPEGQVEETTTTTDDAAELAAQTVLFGAPITVTMTRVEYIVGGGDDDGVEGMEGMEGIEGMEGMDDEMQGPTAEDMNSFIA